MNTKKEENKNIKGVVNNEETSVSKRLTIKRSLPLFSNHIIMSNLAHSTEQAYLSDLNQFVKFLISIQRNYVYVDSISRSDILHFQNHLSKSVKETTIDRKLDSLKKYFDFLIEYSYIASSPTKHLAFKRSKGTYSATADNYPNVLSWDDVSRIIDCAKSLSNNRSMRDIAILEMLRTTGSRRSTVLGLLWTDVNFAKNEITLKHEKTKTKTIVKMSTTLNRALSNLYKVSEDHYEYVFISQKSKQLGRNAFSKLIQKYVEISGVSAKHDFRITSRTFRHSFITHLVRNNIPQVKIIQYTGHTNTDVLSIYTHLVADDSTEVSDLLD